MVREQLASRGITDGRVLAAMQKVPRHLFVPEVFQHRAYGDHPLPIGEKQTISQPYIVALMCQALELKGEEKVLEIGSGSGYQTAVLAELAGRVFAVERIGALAERALRRLEALGYRNVVLRVADGTYGWADEAPFDAIIVGASAPRTPPPLLEQLAVGGRLVMPVGPPEGQQLSRVRRGREGLRWEVMERCVFVPLIGEHGWKEE
ncbi:MAG: protein-L-isoaspartate(D-aspartate) O-methyltransferase [Nitrospinota bacterium]